MSEKKYEVIEATGISLITSLATIGILILAGLISFQPSIPRGQGPGTNTPINIPRILYATSSDGLNFSKGNHILMDSADLPDVFIDSKKNIVVYLQVNRIGQGPIFSALSSKNLIVWEEKNIIINGLSPENGPPHHLNISPLQDGRIRIYFTCNGQTGNSPRILSAISFDGLNFSVESGIRFSGSPFTFGMILKIGEEWHLYTNGINKIHAVSTNGLDFVEKGIITVEGVTEVVLSKGMKVDGGYRIYCNIPGRMPIYSIFSIDGNKWTLEQGTRLQLSSNIESLFIRDPGIVKMENGMYLLIYVTKIP